MAYYNKPSFWNGIGLLGLYLVVLLSINGILSESIRVIGNILLIPGIIGTVFFLKSQINKE